ncbi:MAG: RNA polymerase sigma factor [Myxococcales bacterium FL481]|nr:MAG: RNA polymerase sigma factor [Myxococcales bacterium FL481]
MVWHRHGCGTLRAHLGVAGDQRARRGAAHAGARSVRRSGPRRRASAGAAAGSLLGGGDPAIRHIEAGATVSARGDKKTPRSRGDGHQVSDAMSTLVTSPAVWGRVALGAPAGASVSPVGTIDPAGEGVRLERERTRAAARGDATAQAWLVERLLPLARKVARSLATNGADADDAAQTALLEILRCAGSYRGAAKLETWARRVAVRVTLRQLRRERKRRCEPLDRVETEALVSGCDTRSNDALPRTLRDYLARVSPEQREALVLHHGLGYSIPEVGELLNVSPNTVKGRLRLGSAALRRLYRRDLAIGTRRRGDHDR